MKINVQNNMQIEIPDLPKNKELIYRINNEFKAFEVAMHEAFEEIISEQVGIDGFKLVNFFTKVTKEDDKSE